MRRRNGRLTLNDAHDELAANLSTPPPSWEIVKTMLWRKKPGDMSPKMGKVMVVREDDYKASIPDAEKAWYVRVSVDFRGNAHSPKVSHWIGDVEIEEPGTNPKDELNKLLEQARARVDFLNLNGIKPEPARY